AELHGERLGLVCGKALVGGDEDTLLGHEGLDEGAALDAQVARQALDGDRLVDHHRAVALAGREGAEALALVRSPLHLPIEQAAVGAGRIQRVAPGDDVRVRELAQLLQRLATTALAAAPAQGERLARARAALGLVVLFGRNAHAAAA